MKPEKLENCELCFRNIQLTFHHLVPKKFQNKRVILSKFPQIDLIHYGVWLCNDCHKQVHKLIPLEVLAFNLNNLEKLKSHDKIAKFTRWAARQTKNIKR